MDKKIPEIQYTEDQYSMLSKISDCLYVDWWETSSEEWAIIEFLESEGLCSVAGDREFGTWTLTQRGKQVLENKRRETEAGERQAQGGNIQMGKNSIEKFIDKAIDEALDEVLGEDLDKAVDKSLGKLHHAPDYLPWWAWVPQCVLSVCAIILAIARLAI